MHINSFVVTFSFNWGWHQGCRNMFLKLKSVVLFFKILTCFLLPRPFGKKNVLTLVFLYSIIISWKKNDTKRQVEKTGPTVILLFFKAVFIATTVFFHCKGKKYAYLVTKMRFLIFHSPSTWWWSSLRLGYIKTRPKDCVLHDPTTNPHVTKKTKHIKWQEAGRS